MNRLLPVLHQRLHQIQAIAVATRLSVTPQLCEGGWRIGMWRCFCGDWTARRAVATTLMMIEPPGDEYFMREALRQALKAGKADEVPVGAVIVRAGKVIARAHNQVELLKDATAHAEMLALS